AVKTKLGLKPKDVKSGCVAAKSANYFCDYVSHEIMKDPAFGKTKKERETLLYRGGLTIKTTLDPRLQKEAEKETTKTIPADDSSNMGSAIVTVEPGTGNILAMAQNKKYGSDPDDSSYTTYNLTAGRSMGGTNGFQGGSTMKPYTAIAWLEDGRHMWDKVNAQRRLYDANFHWKASCMPKGYVTVDGGYEPKNFDAGFRKPMTADYGLYWSINTATVNEASQLDLCKIADVTERVGLLNAATGKPITGANPSFVIGADPITPLAQATAFATFANKGEYCKNRALTSVTDAAGNSYKVPGESCEQVIDEQVIANLNGTLKRIAGTRVAKGTIDKPIAGKTGTNNTASSTWFVGYSTGMATAAWTGRFDGNAQIKGVEINGKRYSNPDSSTLAAPLWLEYTKDVIDYYPAKGFGSKDSKPGKSPDHSDSPDNGPAGDAGDDNNDDD
ncbi:MAG: penicillin-binding protein, partial [Micrococcaceae bacterium]|nr:penicillin-binding protein [Micrococcaceae bacterium]